MNLRNAFWVVFSISFLFAIIAWLFQESIIVFLYSNLEVTLQSNSITEQFSRVIFLPLFFLITPFVFLITNIWTKYRNSLQVLILLAGSWLIGVLFLYLRWIYFKNSLKSYALIDEIEHIVPISACQFEWYAFIGSLFGGLFISTFLYFQNVKKKT